MAPETRTRASGVSAGSSRGQRSAGRPVAGGKPSGMTWAWRSTSISASDPGTDGHVHGLLALDLAGQGLDGARGLGQLEGVGVQLLQGEAAGLDDPDRLLVGGGVHPV